MSSTRRKHANDTPKSCEESEETVSQALEDLGLLEDGMTYQDKKDLLNVVRMSENTAQAEEEDRKAKDTQPQVMQQDVEDSPESVIEEGVSEDEDEEGQDIFTITGTSSMPEVSSTSLLVRRTGFLPPHTTTKADMKSLPLGSKNTAMSEISTTSPHTGRVDATAISEISTTSPVAKRTFCLPTDLAALSEISTTSTPKRTSYSMTDTPSKTEIDSTSLLVKGSETYPGDEISTTSSSPVNRFHSLATSASVVPEIGSTSLLSKRMRLDVDPSTPFIKRTGTGVGIPERDKASPSSFEELRETKQVQVSQSSAKFVVKHPMTPSVWLTVSAQADSSRKNVEPEGKIIENETVDEVGKESNSSNQMNVEWTSTSENEKPLELSNTERCKDDKDGNIDVFSYSNNCYQRTFLRRKLRRVQERIPFYFVPKGMDMHRYTSYFKQYIDGYYKRLAALQRRSIEHMKWGEPIEIGNNGRGLLSFSMRSEGEEEANSSRRYNFRDRFPKTRLMDFPSENSDDGGEDSNDDIFTIKNRRLPGIRLGAKRKLNLSNDPTSPKKEKKDSGLVNKKVQNISIASTELEMPSRSEANSEQTSQGNVNDSCDDTLSIRKVPENKAETSTRKRVRKRQQKPSQPEVLDQNPSADCVNTAEESISGLANVSNKKVPRNKRTIPTFQMTRRQVQIFSALTQQNEMCNSVGDITSVDTSDKTLPDCSIENLDTEQQENIVIKPSPINIRPRRKLHPNPDTSDRSVKKKSEPAKVDDVVGLYHSNNRTSEAEVEEQEDRIPCPICGNMFSASEIEEHASDCNMYSEDLKTGSRQERDIEDPLPPAMMTSRPLSK